MPPRSTKFRRAAARVGPTTPTRAGKLAEASVNPTDARRATELEIARRQMGESVHQSVVLPDGAVTSLHGLAPPTGSHLYFDLLAKTVRSVHERRGMHQVAEIGGLVPGNVSLTDPGQEVTRRRPRLADYDLGHHLLVGLLESRAGKRRDHLGDRLLGEPVNSEANDVRARPGADQGDFRTLALDNPA